MALGDYILCCKCECKLIYDGDRSQRTWWEERFGKEPEIECPNCKTSPRQPLTRKQIDEMADDGVFLGNIYEIARAIEAAHGIKGEA